MPRTIMGIISLVMLLILIVHITSIIIMWFINGLGALTLILYAVVTASIGLIFGIAGVVKEPRDTNKIPWITIIVSVILIVLFLITLFGFSFGG